MKMPKTRAVRVTYLIFQIVCTVMIVWMVAQTVAILRSPMTSFPWWAGIVFPAIYCSVPLVLSFAAWMIALYKSLTGVKHEEE